MMAMSRALLAATAALALFADVVIGESDMVLELHGSGTTNPSRFIANVLELFEVRSRLPLHLTYRAVGSSTGQLEFQGDVDSQWQSYTHFGCGDLPFPKQVYDNMTIVHARTFVQIPFGLSTVSVFHSVPADNLPKDGDGADMLRLDACTLAKIYKGEITTWDHDDILALNPGLNVPENTPMRAFHRTLGSSSTYALTGYLAAGCPEHWTAGQGSSIAWVDAESIIAKEGSGGMTEALQGEEWGIAYIDTGHGVTYNLAEAALMNRDGRFLLSGDADMPGLNDALSATLPADPTDDWSGVSAIDLPGEATWPMSLVSFFYVNQNLRDQIGELSRADDASGNLLKAFLEYVLSDAGQALLSEYSFVPLSGASLAKAREAVDMIEVSDPRNEWSFESSTAAGTGANDRVFSDKRVDFDAMRISELEADDAALQEQVAELEEAMDRLNKRLRAEEGAFDIAVAAVVLTVLQMAALIGVAVWACRRPRGKSLTTLGGGHAPSKGFQSGFDARASAERYAMGGGGEARQGGVNGADRGMGGGEGYDMYGERRGAAPGVAGGYGGTGQGYGSAAETYSMQRADGEGRDAV